MAQRERERERGKEKERERVACCEENQMAVSHLLRLLHKSHLGESQRYRTMVHRAVKSLCAYPLPIHTEKEALSLDGVGSFLAKEIMRSLQQRPQETSGAPLSQTDREGEREGEGEGKDEDTIQQGLGLKYKPEQGRGPWAIIIALRTLGGEGSKEEILRCLQMNNVELDPSSALEGAKWSSSIRTLVKKGIISDDRTTPSSRFRFSTQGSELAFRIQSPIASHSDLHIPHTANSNETLALPPLCTFDLTQDSEEQEQPPTTTSLSFPPSQTPCFDLSHQCDIEGDDQTNFNSFEIDMIQSGEPSQFVSDWNGMNQKDSDVVVISLENEEEFRCFSQPTTAQERRQLKTRRVAARVGTKAQTFTSTLTSFSAPQQEVNVSEWEVVILIDKREKDHSFFEAYFNEKGIRSEVCQLAVGDYLWVAKKKNNTLNTNISNYPEESDGYSSENSVSSTQSLGTRRGKKRPMTDPVFVLDCVVERKTVNDLASSIVDGRYEEQKLRLRSSGIANCIYLVEGASLNPQGVKNRGGKTDTHGTGTINTNSILTALAATQVGGLALGLGRKQLAAAPSDESEDEIEVNSSSFHVVNTRGLDHTALHLMCLHRQVEKKFLSSFGNRSSQPLTFDHFQSQSSRKQRVDEVGGLFVYQLRQIPGCSTSAAKAIANKFGTFFNLYTAITSMPSTAFIDTISELKKVSQNGSVSRIGPVLAKYVFSFLIEKRSFQPQRLTVSPSAIR